MQGTNQCDDLLKHPKHQVSILGQKILLVTTPWIEPHVINLEEARISLNSLTLVKINESTTVGSNMGFEEVEGKLEDAKEGTVFSMQNKFKKIE